MWTDAHIHLYDTRRTTVTWPEMASPFPKSVYVPDFLEIAEPCGISRMVSVECTVGGPEEVDNWTLTLTRHDPAVAAVIACADMTSPDFEAVHNRYLEFPKYRGIRVNSISEEKLPMFRENLAVMAKTRAHVVDILSDPKGIQSQEIHDFLWKVATLPNVNMKVSSFITKSPVKPASDNWEDYASIFSACMHAFGTARLLYGSDWPVLEMKGQYENAVKVITDWGLHWGLNFLDDLMGNNCERVYEADMEGV